MRLTVVWINHAPRTARLGPFVYAFQCLTGKFDNNNDNNNHDALIRYNLVLIQYMFRNRSPLGFFSLYFSLYSLKMADTDDYSKRHTHPT